MKCMLNRMQDSSERTQRRYYVKADQCVSLVLDTIFRDEDSDSIKQHLFSEVENFEEDKESPEQFFASGCRFIHESRILVFSTTAIICSYY